MQVLKSAWGPVYQPSGSKLVFRYIEFPENGFYAILDFFVGHMPAVDFVCRPALPNGFFGPRIGHCNSDGSFTGWDFVVFIANKLRRIIDVEKPTGIRIIESPGKRVRIPRI